MWQGQLGAVTATEHRIDWCRERDRYSHNRTSAGPESGKIIKRHVGRPVVKGVHRTGADRVGKPRRTRPETGWVYALLYRIQTLERADRKGLLPVAANGRLFGQFRDSEFLHDA